MELEVDGSDYGMLVEGDIGKLMFQGTRYLALSVDKARQTALSASADAKEKHCTSNEVQCFFGGE